MTLTIILLVIGLIIAISIAVIDEDIATFFILLFLYAIIWVPLSFIPVYVVGFHYNTGEGQHTGYVTAVEKNGLFFKTGSAYIKTDTQSSQEDIYCVIDENVMDELRAFADTKQHITVKYHSWLFPGIKNCGIEGAIIDSVEEIK